jgi:transposase
MICVTESDCGKAALPSPPRESSTPSQCEARRQCPRPAEATTRARKVNGRKRHIAVDTLGLLLCVLVTAASVQDRDGARPLLEQLRASYRRIRLVWADGGYAGKLVDWAHTTITLTVAIVKRSDDATGFVVLPRRWVVERTLAWISGHRRCVRDYERLPAHHEAMVRWSMIRITSRRLTK